MAFVKDPGEVKDYGFNWTEHLGDGETITTSTWEVETGLTSTAFDDTHTDTHTTIWLSEGTAGTQYRVTNHVVTNQGREFERSFTIYVREL